MRNLTFVRHKVKHYPHLWLKVKTRSPPTHADGVSHPKIGHFGRIDPICSNANYCTFWAAGEKARAKNLRSNSFEQGSFSAGSPKQTGPSISAWPCSELLLLLNFAKDPGGYVKNKSPNLIPVWDVRAVLDSSDGLTNVGI